MADVAASKVDSNECLHQIQQMIIDDRETMKANGSKYHEVRKQEAVENQKNISQAPSKEKKSHSAENGADIDSQMMNVLNCWKGKEITIERIEIKDRQGLWCNKDHSVSSNTKARNSMGSRRSALQGSSLFKAHVLQAGAAINSPMKRKQLLNDGRNVRAIDFKSKKGRKFQRLSIMTDLPERSQ